jgi:hypothetical protein
MAESATVFGSKLVLQSIQGLGMFTGGKLQYCWLCVAAATNDARSLMMIMILIWPEGSQVCFAGRATRARVSSQGRSAAA